MPLTNRTISLSPGFPGTTITPLSPPLTKPLLVESDSPPFDFSPE